MTAPKLPKSVSQAEALAQEARRLMRARLAQELGQKSRDKITQDASERRRLTTEALRRNGVDVVPQRASAAAKKVGLDIKPSPYALGKSQQLNTGAAARQRSVQGTQAAVAAPAKKAAR